MKHEDAVTRLVEALKQGALPIHCTSIHLFINSDGYQVKYDIRIPDELKRAGISMKDIHGNWIK